MYTGHPYDCTTRKFPMPCPRCSNQVIYWECHHGSKVFFDDLGQHDCSSRSHSTSKTSPSAPRPSGMTAWATLEGVTESIRPDNYDLLPGMARIRGDITTALAKLKTSRSGSSQRNTVPMEPYGDKREYVIGDVSEIVEVDLRKKFSVDDHTVWARALGHTLPGLKVTQITILVDDILNDPSAQDVMSYTAWCPAGTSPSNLAKRQSVSAAIVPVELLVIGSRWVTESLEIL